MIDYNPKNWVTLLYKGHSGRLRKFLFTNVWSMGVYSLLIVLVFHYWYPIEWVLKTGVHSLLGIVLGLVLVFRTNTAYDRWWEGRKAWGALVNHSRSFAMKLGVVLRPEDTQDRKFFARVLGDFAFSLKNHLRGISHPDDLQHENYPEKAFEGTPHIPNRLMLLIHTRISHLVSSGRMNGDQFLTANRDLDGMVDVLGICERIKNTPIPISYSIYIKKFLLLYLISLPLGFKEEFNLWTIPAVMFITYVLLGIEMIAEEVEDPFGMDANDLPVADIAKTIRTNVEELLRVNEKDSNVKHAESAKKKISQLD